jgi:capsid protein
MMKRIASYFRIPYTILFMDLVEVNYSSWRGGANEMKKMVGRWRRDLNGIVDWVVKTVFLEASVGGFARGDTTKVNISKRWPVQGILDPEKEARANKIRLLNGDTSPQQICDENGEDYDTIMKEMLEHKLALKEQEALVLKRQMELEEKYGIEFNPMEESDGENSDGNGGGKKDDTGDGDNEGTEEEKEKRKEGGNW